MDWLTAHAAPIGALFGAALAAWAFFSKVDATYRVHLKEEFATKSDFHRLETKLDSLREAFWTSAPRRRGSRKKKRSSTSF